LARLHEHGLIDSNPLVDVEPDRWMQSALDAIAVGKALGDSVILMTCSTGSTLGMYLAATYPDLIHSHIMLSPNVDVFDPRSGLLVQPWGLQITRFVLGSKFYGWDAPGLANQYWYTKYRAEGLVTLKSVIEATMTRETFEKIDEPVFIAYYYRDEDHQDKTVSVARMRVMYDQLGTPDALKREVALADAGTHIIGSDIFNRNLESLWQPLTAFCEEVIKLPVADTIGWQPYVDKR
jgi:pimeloyl-ACP methyl ester carboxylesterase